MPNHRVLEQVQLLLAHPIDSKNLDRICALNPMALARLRRSTITSVGRATTGTGASEVAQSSADMTATALDGIHARQREIAWRLFGDAPWAALCHAGRWPAASLPAWASCR